MSCIPLEKKLLPSKKAWRSFTSKLQSRLQVLKRFKQVTSHVNNIFGRPTQSPYRLRHNKKVRAKKLLRYRSFAPVYVDELFQSQPELMAVGRVEPPGEVKKAVEKSLTTGRFGATTAGSSSSLPFETSCSVDARAEMFIAKFRESMRLERQRSVEKYQEMMARGL